MKNFTNYRYWLAIVISSSLHKKCYEKKITTIFNFIEPKHHRSILTRRLAGEISVDVMQFHSGFVGTVVLLPFAILSWQSPDTMMDWAIMIMLGVFGWMGHQLLTHAHSFAAANVLTPFGYSFILFLTTWSYLVFDHLPDIWTVIGASIIITSGLIIWFREMKKAKVMQP